MHAERHVCLHLKLSFKLCALNEHQRSSDNFCKISEHKISWKRVQRFRYERTERQNEETVDSVTVDPQGCERVWEAYPVHTAYFQKQELILYLLVQDPGQRGQYNE